jgi:hypothetical protein
VKKTAKKRILRRKKTKKGILLMNFIWMTMISQKFEKWDDPQRKGQKSLVKQREEGKARKRKGKKT